MINCPNCGTPVREDARFCGNCGIDVQAALAAQQQALAQQQAALNQPSPSQPQYSYPLQTTNYGGYNAPHEERNPLMSRLLIAGILVIAVACAFCCGIFFGFELSGMVGGAPAGPAPRSTAAPQGMLLLQQVIQWIG